MHVNNSKQQLILIDNLSQIRAEFRQSADQLIVVDIFKQTCANCVQPADRPILVNDLSQTYSESDGHLIFIVEHM